MIKKIQLHQECLHHHPKCHLDWHRLILCHKNLNALCNRPELHLVESSVYSLDKSKRWNINNTKLLATKSSITLCSEVVVALVPVLRLKLALAPELEAFGHVKFCFQLNKKISDLFVINNYKKLTLVYLILQWTAVLMGPSVWRFLIQSAALVKETSLKLVDPMWSNLLQKMR